ncbi:MAG TPA: HAD family hydrolase [Tepidisphaeraceae bacterium]|jgi:HAD superfamily hydrolase (TIGR01549 family)|nr:HAD family hydrolase [Tepidisphaeraceae bacterium]
MPALPKVILFDMDGTITQPMLDFPRIKRDMGIGQRPILEALAEMDEHARQIAQSILHRHEEEAAANSILNPGCKEILAWLNRHQIEVAVITRNSRASVKTVCERHGLHFEVLITREDGKFKPDPAPLLEACQRLNVEKNHAWMVGDGQYDVEAGLAAAIRTVWLSHGRPKPFAADPWRAVQDLHELTALLQDCLNQR